MKYAIPGLFLSFQHMQYKILPLTGFEQQT